MSCNYAEGLSPYSNKGTVGAPEHFDPADLVEEKSKRLAEWILDSKHVVVHTGAGISTSAGIPDFRGPNGVWTLEKQGKKPNIDISFSDAVPTKTHMAIKQLLDKNYVHYVVSQNIDGLHMRTGIPRKHIAELHGNMFTEQCNSCNSQFVRCSPAPTVGKKCLETDCRRLIRGRPCRGKLYDTILDWEHSLPDLDLEMSDYQSSLANINICLGTTLQIVPSGNLPLKCKKYGGKLVIINLQATKHNKKADLVINAYVDQVMEKVMKHLNLEIPEYSKDSDPTKNTSSNNYWPLEWNISKNDVNQIKKSYTKLCREHKKRKQAETKDPSLKLWKLKRVEVLKEHDEVEVEVDGSQAMPKMEPKSAFSYNSTNGVNMDLLSEFEDKIEPNKVEPENDSGQVCGFVEIIEINDDSSSESDNQIIDLT